jgi:hypothetical protein
VHNIVTVVWCVAKRVHTRCHVMNACRAIMTVSFWLVAKKRECLLELEYNEEENDE